MIAARGGAWGVLGAHARTPRRFAPDEADFLRSVANVVSSAVDRNRVDEEVRHRAMHDPLTGLPNRALALDRLEGALARRRRDGRAVAVLLADLDQFKLVNDSMGHRAGDDLLVALAPRLHDAVRPSDTVARLGGDEFLVVCEQLDGPHEAIRVAERVAQAINQPIVLAAGEHFVTASIGIAVADRADADPADLLRDADAAMYRAKERGRGRYELFDDVLRKRVLTRLRTENELRRGIEHDELRVVYQPVIELSDGSVTAVEALVRWQHPERGTVDPVDFIPVAEESGLIGALGDWVLTAACRDGAAWQARYPRAEPLLVCVNTSPRQLANGAFPARVADIMGRHGLAPGSLALEITESVLMEEAHAPVTVLASLREYGLRLMLDDFGTGYSSLSYLKRFPLDVLKIDRSFVAGLGRDEEDSAIVAAIVQMAQTLGLMVIAEGVERPEQLERLRELGCDRAQGRLIAGPMPAERVDRLMASATAGVVMRVFDGHNDVLSKRVAEGAAGLPRRRRRRAPRPAARRGGGAGRRLLRGVHLQPARGRLRRRARTSRRSTPTGRGSRRSRRSRSCSGSSASPAGACASRAPRPTSTATGSPPCSMLEGAEPIGTGLDELLVLHAAGLRSLGLVWSRPNAFATGVPFGFPGSPDQGPGLTDAGRALVRACGELGILVDVSHLNAKGFWEVAELGAGPLVASHSGAHALCASPRNLTDDQLRAIGERDGLVGINFHVGFLRADGSEDADTPLERIAEHAAYVAEVAGAALRRARLGLRRGDRCPRRSATCPACRGCSTPSAPPASAARSSRASPGGTGGGCSPPPGSTA